MRRLTYKLPENDLRHWLMLIAADRVNTVEGIVDDLCHGHVPNVLGEMGIRSELRYNPAGLGAQGADRHRAGGRDHGAAQAPRPLALLALAAPSSRDCRAGFRSAV